MNYILKKSKYGRYVLIVYKDNLQKSEEYQKENYIRDYDDESSRRSKRIVLDLALNNDFDWFQTFTFHEKGSLVDNRQDFQRIKKRFLQAINNYNKRFNVNLKYIVVPELHANKKGYHFHCLMSGFDTKNDYKFIGFDKKKGHPIFRTTYFYERFGANRGIRIMDYNRFVAYYVSKYITKQDDRIFYRRYFRSNNLDTSEVLMKGVLTNENMNQEPSYENALLKVYEFETLVNLEFIKGEN